MTMKPVLVTGGRDYEDRQRVFETLNKLRPNWLIVGDCPTGADKWAREWAKEDSVCYAHVFAADWNKHGRAAGPIRNGEMVEKGLLMGAMVVAFPGGRGTEDCIRQARRKGLHIHYADTTPKEVAKDG